MRKELREIWDQQQFYNAEIQRLQKKSDAEWLLNYVLGAHRELSELLDQTGWKSHRIADSKYFGPNIEEELADITKYVFSMWQQMGFSEQDMLRAIHGKGEILHQLLYQETRPPLEKRNILMLDLDGVVADFRQGFMTWVEHTHWQDILTVNESDSGLHMDINNGWNYRSYYQAKMEFERDGGYGTLPPVTHICKCANILHQIGWYIIVYTARPYTTFRRIWSDTWSWLKLHEVEVDELHFGYDDRVVAASHLSERNHVIALEDDPTLALRYTRCNIPVLLCPQPYNQHLFLNTEYLRVVDREEEYWELSKIIQNTSTRGKFYA